MKEARRKAPREQVALPLKTANGCVGKTRDVSASGLFIEIDCEQPRDGEIELTVDLSLDERVIQVECRGQVVGKKSSMAGRVWL